MAPEALLYCCDSLVACPDAWQAADRYRAGPLLAGTNPGNACCSGIAFSAFVCMETFVENSSARAAVQSAMSHELPFTVSWPRKLEVRSGTVDGVLLEQDQLYFSAAHWCARGSCPASSVLAHGAWCDSCRRVGLQTRWSTPTSSSTAV